MNDFKGDPEAPIDPATNLPFLPKGWVWEIRITPLKKYPMLVCLREGVTRTTEELLANPEHYNMWGSPMSLEVSVVQETAYFVLTNMSKEPQVEPKLSPEFEVGTYIPTKGFTPSGVDGK